MQLSRAGEVREEGGVSTAREQLDDLLVDRLRETGHEFLGAVALHDSVTVGWLWISPAPAIVGPACDARWLSQITVSRSHRGEGWGRAMLLDVERHLALRGRLTHGDLQPRRPSLPRHRIIAVQHGMG